MHFGSGGLKEYNASTLGLDYQLFWFSKKWVNSCVQLVIKVDDVLQLACIIAGVYYEIVEKYAVHV